MQRMRAVRSTAIVALLLGGGGVLIASTQPWLSVTLRQDGTTETLTVIGSDMAPGAVALGYVLLALVAAILLTGRIWRTVFGAVGVVAAAATGLILLTTLLDRTAAAAQTITKATGITGDSSIAQLVDDISLTMWPVLATSAVVLALAGAAIVVVSAGRWPSRTKRYDAATARTAQAAASGATASLDPIDEWDALSGGTDPTD